MISQICKVSGAKPIDYVFDYETDSYDLSPYKTDADLLEKIRNGRTEQSYYREHMIEVQEVFGDIEPKRGFYQNFVTGENNIESATVALYGIYPHYLPVKWIEQLTDLV